MKDLQLSIVLVGSWCLLAIVAFVLSHYHNPVEPAKEPVFNSEELRAIHQEWERLWYLDEPSQLSPQRIRGGVI